MSEESPRKKSKKGNAQPIEIPPIPNRPQQCHFFVLRKRRYCGLPARKGLNYCGEHMAADPNNDNAKSELKRIPCPYDASHTIFEKDLENHLKNRCNARHREKPACYSLNVNCTLPLSAEELEFQKNIYSHQKMHVQPWLARVQLDQLSRDELDNLINKVSAAYDANVNHPLAMEKLSHPSAEKKRPLMSNTKHLDQLSSLIGHMDKNDMLKDKTACFVEFGAGKGDLSAFIKRAVAEENGESTYLLLDRKSVRNKVDQTLLGRSEKKSTVQRQLIDIKDLVLSKVDCIADNNKKVVAVSKHLCGCATDISLKCLMNYVKEETEKGNSEPVSGVVVALCCHQICRYEMYPNQEYLESIGMSKTDFERMCKMSSWATCNSQAQEKKKEGENDEEHANDGEEADMDQTTNHFSGRESSERESIGYKCKRVIDAGRAKYLEQFGFDVKLVYYVDLATSLENCALIATPKKQE